MRRWLLVAILILLHADSGKAAGIFKRSPKPDPAVRVPILLKQLKDDPDDGKRADAAEELRDYDLKAFPDIMPALIDALQNDPSSVVRSHAANSMGRLRPISQQAGYALEQALQNDSSMRVRWAARTTLWEYHLLGYRSGKPPEKGVEQTDEPPLAEPLPAQLMPMKPQAVVPKEKPASSQPWLPRPLLPSLFPRRETPKTDGPTLTPAPVSPNAEKPTLKGLLAPKEKTPLPESQEGPALTPPKK